MAAIITLAELAHADRRSHVIVDSRTPSARTTWTLRNAVFDVVDLPPEATDDDLAGAWRLIDGRDAIVVDERSARAAAACERLAARGTPATVLEDGLRGWTQAVVLEGTDRYAGATVASFVRPARSLRSYVVLTAAGTTIVDACGSATLLLRETRSLGALPTAIVDTAYHRDRISCGPECAQRAEATYWVPPNGEDRIDERIRRRIEAPTTINGLLVAPHNGGANLRLDGPAFGLGAYGGATYRTCCGPESNGSKTYDAVNRGMSLVDEGRRWQLEFGPPGCLPH